MNAQNWIDRLGLIEHPEGGYFRETYRADITIPQAGLPTDFDGPRSCSTAIYFLVTHGRPSRLHRLRADEVWHFYDGDPLTLCLLHPDGRLEKVQLGRNPDAGQVLQAVVPAGCWFGSLMEQPGGFALVGCTVAPGFDFKDFELGRRSELRELFPEHRLLVDELAVPDAEEV